ncbi:MAG: hypothetical protein HC878_03445 [Leptolyngbyaceae cyanobacterium SL_5_14]|nr:hypothetical protein [Leptolyngbyaceae cyanobacterium SL_5_14]NJO66143.1 hypothetical protein [Leptolyngbyaceae cyanobacterium RM1_405_57]
MAKASATAKEKVTPIRPGRPVKEVLDDDIRVIEKLAGRGLKLDDIACALDISSSTLDRWLKLDEVGNAYKRGRAIATDAMTSRLWDIAMSDDGEGKPTKQATAAVFFWLKCQAGWTEKPKEEVQSQAQVIVYVPDNQRGAA